MRPWVTYASFAPVAACGCESCGGCGACPSCGSCPSCDLRLRRLWMRLSSPSRAPLRLAVLARRAARGSTAAGKPERTIDVSPLPDARYAAAGRHADSGAQDVERYQALDER